MKKSDIAARVATQTSLSKADAAGAVDGALSAISNALAQGESAGIAGFGTFSVKHRAAREGRNLRTGEPVATAASKLPSFTAGKGLRDAVDRRRAVTGSAFVEEMRS